MVISGSDDRTVRVWDLATGTPVGDPFTGHNGWVRAVAVGGAGWPARWSISGSDDRTVRVWDLATGTPVGDPFTGHMTARCTRWRSRSWRPARGHLRRRRRDGAGMGPGHRHPGRRPVHRPRRTVHAVAVAELDGRPVVISGGDDGTVRVWDLATGTPVSDPFTGHDGSVRAVAVAELDGRPVVISGSDDRTVRVWDLATGTPVGDPFTGHDDPVHAVAVGGAGRPARGHLRRR